MSKSEYIHILAKASKTDKHELIEECLTTYKKVGTLSLTIEELHNFCVSKHLL